MIRSAKMRFFYERFENDNDSKSLWNTIRYLNVGKSTQKLSEPVINVDDLNAHYSSVSTVRDERQVSEAILEYENRIEGNAKTEKFHFKYVLPEDIINAVYSIKSKATGVDGVSIMFIMMCLPALLPVLDHLFNFSLQNGSFPSYGKRQT